MEDKNNKRTQELDDDILEQAAGGGSLKSSLKSFGKAVVKTATAIPAVPVAFVDRVVVSSVDAIVNKDAQGAEKRWEDRWDKAINAPADKIFD